VHDPVVRALDRLKWCLWHGKVSHALPVTPSVATDLEAAIAHMGDGLARQCLNAVEECRMSIENTRGFIPHDGERDRQGERISTGVVASTVKQGVRKQMVKPPQLVGSQRGTPLLQIRTQVCKRRGKRRSVRGRAEFDHQLARGQRAPGNFTVAPRTDRGGGWSRRRTGWPMGSGAPCTSHRGENDW
jgi:hypothetical protein